MDTLEFMREFVNRQVGDSPVQAVTDPKVEILTEMSRQADLDSHVAQVSETTGEETRESNAEVDANPPEEFQQDQLQTEAAVPTDVEDSESLEVVAGHPSETLGHAPRPESPVESVSEHAEPAEVFQESGPAAESAELPADVQTPAAESDEPPVVFTEHAVPEQVIVDPATPRAQITLEGTQTTATHVPENLPFDFDGMLGRAQAQIKLPDIENRVSVGGDQGIFADLPDFPDFDPQPSTDYAESRLKALSQSWKQWERRT